jgi:uncharacterized protein
MSALFSHVSCEMLVTTACNLRCSYCIEKELQVLPMPDEVAARAIDLFMFLAHGAQTAEIIVTGGEPLMRFRSLRSIVGRVDLAAREHGISYQLVLKTNGTMMTAEIADFLKDGPWRVVVSIDGSEESHDRHRNDRSGRSTWHAVTAAVAVLMERGVECVASMTVHPSACSTVLRNVRELQKLGLNRIDIGPAYGTVQWSEVQSQHFAESLGKLAALMKSEFTKGRLLEIGPLYQESEHVQNQLRNVWGCKAGSSNLAFLPDGSIAGCSALAMLAPRFPHLILGDVWNGLDSDAIVRLRQDAGAGVRSRPQCKRCPTRDNCAGGCLAINYSSSGIPLQPPQFYCKTIAAIPEAWKVAWGSESENECC